MYQLPLGLHRTRFCQRFFGMTHGSLRKDGMLAGLLVALKSIFFLRQSIRTADVGANGVSTMPPNTDTFNAAVRASFYRYQSRFADFEVCDHYNHESGKCPQLLEFFNAGFYRGAQFATKTTGELSPYIAKFIEFMMWITDEPSNGIQLGLDQE